MKKALVTAILCLVATVALASTRVIPVAGHLPGANGTSWTTDVSLANSSATPVTVDLVFHPEDGIARTRSIFLDAKQSVLLEDAVGPTQFPGSNPASWLGQLEVRSTGEISASAHIFTSGAGGGTFGSTYEGFDPAALSTTGAMTGLIVSTRFRTNVAFANPGDQTATFDYVLRFEDGSVVATRHQDVPPHSTRQLSLGDDVATSPTDDRLSLAWSSNVAAYVVGSIIDNRSGDPTNAPSMSRDVTSLFFPVVGRVPGSNGTFWSTSAAVSSTSGAAGIVTFAYHDSASGQTYTKSSAIAALGTVATDDVNTFVGAPAGLGSLAITSTTNVVGAARVFNTQADGSTFGSAVLAQDNVVESSHVRIDGVRRDDDYRLNVAISNEDSTVANGTVRLYDDHGLEVENEPFHVEHGRSIQVAMNHGSVRVRSGEIEVETEHGVVVIVTASNIDNRTGDTIQRESEQENERQNDIEIELNPRLTTVGTPVFFSLRHAGSNVSTVNWAFGDGTTATGAQTSHAYASAGEYDVAMEVVLIGGTIVRDREDVRVAGSGTPIPGTGAIDFTFTPVAPAVGEQVVFTAIGATDGGSFKWSFPGNVHPIGNVVMFTFSSASSFEVELEIEHGATQAQVTRIVTVGGGSPGDPGTGPLEFTFLPTAPAAGQEVTFIATGATGGGSYKWKFPGDIRKFGKIVTFTFAAAGSYEVELEIEHGTIVAQVQHFVTVGGGTPGDPGTGPLEFTFSPGAPAAGQEVTFTASGATGGGSYKWKFPGDIRKSGKIVTFTFAAAGSYEVELEIEHGTIDGQVQHVVTVGGGTPGGGQNVTSIDFSWSPSSAKAGQPVTFTASFDRSPPPGSVVKWRFPDDSRPEGNPMSYTFSAAGTFKVRVEIEQAGLESIEREKSITVTP